MTERRITLVGDGITNPWNARTMLHAAAMFDGECVFRDRAKLAAAWQEAGIADDTLHFIDPRTVAHAYSPVIAFDTLDGAESVYGFRMPAGEHPAVIVGNEQRGLSHEMQRIASHTVQIPLASRTLNSLNVAAASAVALYYLSRGGGGAMHIGANPRKRRPELLVIGGADYYELGSTIRSAGAFGWPRVLIADRAGVWFGADRVTRSEGRAAARRARNPIRLIPTTPGDRFAFARVSVITMKGDGVPLHRANLVGGPQHLIALPDEEHVNVTKEDWQRLANEVTFVRVEVPAAQFAYHLRLIATIALAEIARQVGHKSRVTPRPAGRTPRYDAVRSLLDGARGETVFLDDLACY